MKSFEKLFPFFLIIGIFLNANGLLLEILEPDGALYATISKHMVVTGDWLNIWADGHDWLDKPHFPFWMCAIGIKIFGITAFGYKFPAFIFWLISIAYTYFLAKDLYNTLTAKVAVIIYIFSLHGILNNFDIRAEPFLTALSIAAIYHFYKAHVSGKWKHVIAAAFMSACAVMTKGIFVLITIAAGFVIYWIKAKQWKQFINYKWWVMVVLILLFITPELYSLYNQFDIHPEKIVFGRTNVSGLKFFFWDSQFGRFFNTGPIKGEGDKTFFLHTTLWAYLPWSVLLYIAVFYLIKNRRESNESKDIRWTIYGSALVTFILFSLSAFQLPHYIVILFPQFSIITAEYLIALKKERSFRPLSILQMVLLLLACLAVVLLSYYSHIGNTIVFGGIAILISLVALLIFRRAALTSVVAFGCALSVVLFVYMLNSFYPAVMKYQSGVFAGKWVKENNYKAAMFNSWSYTYEYYSPDTVARASTSAELDQLIQKAPHIAYYTSEAALTELQNKGYKCKVLERYDYFHISMLTPEFLNYKTRSNEVEKIVLATIEKQ